MKTQIVTFKDQEIYCPVDENRTVFVAIKPICEALGISFQGQHKRILEDEILSQLSTIQLTVGRDEKQREMLCLPLQFVFGWLFTIDHNAVKPEAKETVLAYKLECYKALYNHFYGNLTRTIEINQQEIALLEAINQHNKAIAENKAKKKSLETDLEELRAKRLNGNANQLEMF